MADQEQTAPPPTPPAPADAQPAAPAPAAPASPEPPPVNQNVPDFGQQMIQGSEPAGGITFTQQVVMRDLSSFTLQKVQEAQVPPPPPPPSDQEG